ncbi:MAG TPA: 6-bladed beta-propeller [Ramlibacter sp.]
MSPLSHRRSLLLGLAGSALLASCAVAPGGDRKEDEDVGDLLWPLPPELPRFAYETTLRSVSDVQKESKDDEFRRRMLGTARGEVKALEKPSCIAARDGRIYVGDAVRRNILVFDAPRRRVFQFGIRAPGTLAKPSAIALDRGSRVYVADSTLRRVFVYDTLGLHQVTIGTPAQLQRPTGVAVNRDGSLVYVIDRSDNDSELHRVLVYGADGKLLREIGRRGSGEGEFNVPVQAVVTPDGNLHVLDAGNFRVQSFDAEGRFLRSFGRVGNGLGQFARPRALACDDEGRLYVTDGSFGNVQIFTDRGELLLGIGRASTRDRPGRYGLITGVAVDNTGRLYVADQLYQKVEVIRRVGEEEARALQAKARG